MDIDSGLATITGITLVVLGSGLLAILVLDAWQRVVDDVSSSRHPESDRSLEAASASLRSIPRTR